MDLDVRRPVEQFDQLFAIGGKPEKERAGSKVRSCAVQERIQRAVHCGI
jgi:hypothetical protein